ncbi:ubiquitin-protein ligase E3C-like [Saccostrea echinata]|uniref:ubiquitin-protein ligase E3C-like n=1 Tax=Saccostrea echinata TaxID=191078 RepID=UPI002A834895|nr:ubiquitin-protein ligase E3C-like [Saccostrea echinata]
MYSFEGDFRRKPVQSLRGASKKELTDSLLTRTKVEREKREEIRQRNSSSVKIQSAYRGHIERKRQREVLRHEYDQLMTRKITDSVVLFDAIRRLCYFYRTEFEKDQDRLIQLCQVVIKQTELVKSRVTQGGESGVFLLQHLLLLCLKNLQKVTDSRSWGPPIRVLEIFTSVDTYKENRDIIGKIWLFLIKKEYFGSMRHVLEVKVPQSLEKSPHPPTPQADSIFKMILSPIQFAVMSKDKEFCDLVLSSICYYLFCPAYSEQVEQFLIPAMVYSKFPFPFVELIQTLIQQTSASCSENFNTKPSLVLTPSPWLLGSVIAFADKNIENLSVSDAVDFLLVLRTLLPHLPAGVFMSSSDSDTDSSDEEESVDMISKELHEVATECVTFLNSQKFVRCVVECLNRRMDRDLVSSVCLICHSLMSQQHLSIHKLRLLYSLAFNMKFMKLLWITCTHVSNTTVTGSQITLLQTLSRGLEMSDDDMQRIVPLLSVFCSMFSHSLYTLHDADFYGDMKSSKDSSMPFSLKELVPMVLMLRDTCLGIIELAHPGTRPSVTEDYREALRRTAMKDPRDLSYHNKETPYRHTKTWAYLFKVIATLVRQLYTRDSRRRFCPINAWLSERVQIHADKPSQMYRARGSVFCRRPFGTMRHLTKVQIDDDGPPLSNTDVKNLVILTELPFVVSFEERVKILQKLIQNDREENQGDAHNFLTGPSINVSIRRNYIYEDAYDKLSPENEPNLKLKMRVQLMNAAGLDEAGIDGGGIFREFLSELLKTGFDPNRGLFLMTTDRLLYPNPQSVSLMDNYTKHYYFLGRMLGKAIYENMLVEIPFATFFLSKILSRHGGDLDIHHLASLDPEMYKNLLSLKTLNGKEVEDLGLDFTTLNDNFGEKKVVELKPGGRNIVVTDANKIEYIHLMADYKINKQIRTHCTAFRQGMADLINLEWLRMFDHHELQTLISGAMVPVNIEDLKQHTHYSGGYTGSHPVIQNFWEVVENFTDTQKRQLLKFVTSCSRPPLLGFKDLYPAFCVHFGGSEEDRLPTASTCMNLLKLPEFHDKETLRTKLAYAIESGAGFELS